MKKILAAVFFGLLGMANAVENSNINQLGNNAFGGDLSQQTALAYTRAFTYELNSESIDKVSAMINYGTATIAGATFTDGRTSSGTITIVSTPTLCGTIVTVNGTRFNFGGCPPYNSYTDTLVTIGGSVSQAAARLLNAITHNADTMYITTGTLASGVINLVSLKADGVGYALTSSAPSLVTLGGNMGLGVLTKVSASTDKIYMASHNMTTGLPVTYHGGVVIGGLTTTTTYYAYRVDANYIKLATTSAQAVLADTIDITSVVENATETTYTILPLDNGSTASLIWQVSNDGTNWMTAMSSSAPTIAWTITNATADTTTRYDFGSVNHRFIRLNVTGLATGGIKLNTWLYLKR